MNRHHHDPLAKTSIDTGLFGFVVNRAPAPPAPVHRNPRDTEVAAARRVKTVLTGLRLDVFNWIKEAGEHGATGKELGRRLAIQRGLDPENASARYSAMPRATELAKAGLVTDSGKRREGSIAWISTPGKAVQL